MPNPVTQWAAVLVDTDGKVKAETTQYFTAKTLARDGSKAMLRMAPDESYSVALFRLDARLEMLSSFKVVDV